MMAASVAEDPTPIVGSHLGSEWDDGTLGLTSATLGFSFGAAASDRTLAAIITFPSNADRTISSVTIGGVSATQIVHKKRNTLGNWVHAALYKAAVPSGTSGNVVVNLSGTTGLNNGIHVALFRILGVSTQVSSSGEGVDDGKTTLAVQAGDFLIAGGLGTSSPSNTATVGVVERWDNAVGNTRRGGGDYSPVATATVPVELHFIGAASVAMVCAAFRA